MLIYSPRRKPRHAPSLRRLIHMLLTRAFYPKRTVAGCRFLRAANHQRIIMEWVKDLRAEGFFVARGPNNSVIAIRKRPHKPGQDQ